MGDHLRTDSIESNLKLVLQPKQSLVNKKNKVKEP